MAAAAPPSKPAVPRLNALLASPDIYALNHWELLLSLDTYRFDAVLRADNLEAVPYVLAQPGGQSVPFQTDVVLLDAAMRAEAGGSLLRLVARFRACAPRAAIACLAQDISALMAAAEEEANSGAPGAWPDGFLLKNDVAFGVATVLQRVWHGGFFISPGVAACLTPHLVRRLGQVTTLPAWQENRRLVCQSPGRTVLLNNIARLHAVHRISLREVARRLGRRVQTVTTYFKEVHDRLDAVENEDDLRWKNAILRSLGLSEAEWLDGAVKREDRVFVLYTGMPVSAYP